MRHQTTHQARYLDLDDLRCPCGAEVADGPDGFAHRDGCELCEIEPVEVAR